MLQKLFGLEPQYTIPSPQVGNHTLQHLFHQNSAKMSAKPFNFVFLYHQKQFQVNQGAEQYIISMEQSTVLLLWDNLPATFASYLCHHTESTNNPSVQIRTCSLYFDYPHRCIWIRDSTDLLSLPPLLQFHLQSGIPYRVCMETVAQPGKNWETDSNIHAKQMLFIHVGQLQEDSSCKVSKIPSW